MVGKFVRLDHAETQTTTMKTAIYARVSTEDQSAEMQLRELRDFCRARAWAVTREYVEQESGASHERPLLTELLQDSKRRKHDIVLVWRFDRFARSTSHLLSALETFRSLGIQFCSYTEGIDTSTPVGKVVFTIVAAIAEFEREMIRERVRAGLRNARANGKELGRPRVAVDIQEIARLRAKNHSWSAISRLTGLGKATCQRAFATRPKNLLKTS